MFRLFFPCFLFCLAVLPLDVLGSANPLGDLLHATVLHRHGDRSPVHVNPPRAAKWRSLGFSPGSLTSRGLSELRAIGESLASAYSSTSEYAATDSILPNITQIQSNSYTRDMLYIRSTAVDRCILSVQSLLNGLLNPTNNRNFNPLLYFPVHSVPEDIDRLLQPTDKCPSSIASLQDEFHLFNQEILNPSNDNTARWNFTEAFVNDLLEWSGWKNKKDKRGKDRHISWIFNTVTDNLICERAHALDKDWPKWVQDKADELEQFTRWMWVQRFRVVKGDPRGPVGGILLQDWFDKAVLNREPMEVMRIHSAHDSTIAALMGSLLLLTPEASWSLPGYGSSVIFELREKAAQGNKKQFLNIWYAQPIRNGNQIRVNKQPIQFPCPSSASGSVDPWSVPLSAQCEVGAFQRFVESLTHSASNTSWSTDSLTYPPHDGCCYRASNYLSQCPPSAPFESAHEACKLYRRMCPSTACGSSHVLNYQSYECVEAPVVGYSGESVVTFPVLADFGLELRALSILVFLSTLFGALIGFFTYHNRESSRIQSQQLAVAADQEPTKVSSPGSGEGSNQRNAKTTNQRKNGVS